MGGFVQRWALITGVAAALGGCRYGQTAAFATGGTPNSDDDDGGGGGGGGDGDGGPSGDDTAAPSTGGDPPVLHNVDAQFDEYPNIGWVVEIVASYTDADGDVDGGKIYMLAEVDDQPPDEKWVTIDGVEAFVDPDAGTVFYAVEVAGDDVNVFLTIALKDLANNLSNEVTTQAY